MSVFKKSLWTIVFPIILIFILNLPIYARWSQNISPTTQNLKAVYLHSLNNTAWCVGENGTVLKATVGLNNWNPISLFDSTGIVSSHLYDIKFIKIIDPVTQIKNDTQTGFIVGAEGAVFKTTDGGATQQRQDVITTSSNLNSIFFALDGQKGWIVGDNGILLKTTNAGGSWALVTTGFSTNFYGIAFSEMNTNSGVIVGANGLILQTTDGGITWSQIIAYDIYSQVINVDLNSIGTANDYGRMVSRFWIAGNQATLLYSDDNGTSWTQYPAVISSDLNRIFFHNSFVYGYSVGNSGTILFNIEGFPYWNLQKDSGLITQLDLYSVSFNNQFNGYAVGDTGTILYTNDGGANHQATQSYCSNCHYGELPVIHGFETAGYSVCGLVCHGNLDIITRSPECESCHGTQPAAPVPHSNMDTLHTSQSYCINCHNINLPTNHINPDNGYPDLNSTCFRCHRTPLIETATSACESCHGSQLPVQHTDFQPKHTSTRECTSCHGTMLPQVHVNASNGYPDENSTCVRCHNNPLINISISSADCGTCHGVQIPQEHQNITKHVSTNTYCTQCHSTDLPLNHVNETTPYTSTCNRCHGTSLMATATSDCQSCHGTQIPAEHVNFTPVHTISNTCSQCHGTILSQIHKSPEYPTENSTCFRCHPKYTAPITQWNNGCSACHGSQLPQEHANVNHTSASQCTTCHETELPTVHNNNCGYCHWLGVTPPSPYPNVDISAVYNRECRDCHGTQIPKEHLEASGKHQANTLYGPDIYCTDCHGQYKIDELHEYNCMSCHKKYTDPIITWNNDCSTCHNTTTGLPVHFTYETVRGQLFTPPDDISDGQQQGVHGYTRADVPCLTCHNPYRKADIESDAAVREWFSNRCVVCHVLKTNMGTSDTKGCRPCHFYSNYTTYDFYFNEFLNNNFKGSKIWGHNILKRNNENKTLGKHDNQGKQ